jgi:transcription elongation factor Elf1
MNMLRRFMCLVMAHRTTSNSRVVGDRRWMYTFCERCGRILAMKVL